MPLSFIRIKANSNENGIVKATTKAERRLPRKISSTRITIVSPSSNVCDTVSSVLSTSDVRSYIGVILTPSGNSFIYQILHLVFQGLQNFRRVLSAPHGHDTFYARRRLLAVVEYGISQNALWRWRSDLSRGYIVYKHRHTVYAGDNDIAYIVFRAYGAYAAYGKALPAALYNIAAGVEVVLLNSFDNLGQRKLILAQLLGVVNT